MYKIILTKFNVDELALKDNIDSFEFFTYFQANRNSRNRKIAYLSLENCTVGIRSHLSNYRLSLENMLDKRK